MDIKDIKALIKKNKVAVIAIVVVVLGIIGYKHMTAPTPKKAIDQLSIKYEGYSNRGEAYPTDKSLLKGGKMLIRFEARKAGLNKKHVNELVNTSDSMEELFKRFESRDELLVDASNEREVTKVDDFISHVKNSGFNFPSRMLYSKLKNGDKLTIKIEDRSSKPYFKAISKTYKVKGLKKLKEIKLSKSDFKFKVEGVDGHGEAELDYKNKNVTPDALEDTNIKNGDTLTVKSTDLAKIVNEKMNKEKILYSIKDKKLAFKVSDLKPKSITVSNFDEINKKIQDSDELNNEPSDDYEYKIIASYLNSKRGEFNIVYQVKSTMEYKMEDKSKTKTHNYVVEFDGIKLHGNKIDLSDSDSIGDDGNIMTQGDYGHYTSYSSKKDAISDAKDQASDFTGDKFVQKVNF